MPFIRVPANQYETQGTLAGDRIIGRDEGPNLIYGGAAGDEIDSGDLSDLLFGGSGNDIIRGHFGDDTITGNTGNDMVYGDEGDDYLYDTDGGNDMMYGGLGADLIVAERYQTMAVSDLVLDGGSNNDNLRFISENGSTAQLIGGAGADTLFVAGTSGSATLDGGSGNDAIDLTLEGIRYQVTTGIGADEITFMADREFFSLAAPVVITDFTAGAGGDNLVLSEMLAEVLDNWDGAANPFATGHLALTQSGNDTLLSVDVDGGGDNFVTLARFQGTTVGAFTTANLEYAPDGAAPISSITTVGNETYGSVGNDDIIVSSGTVFAGAGADTITLNGSATVYGGPGNNTISGSNSATRDTLYGGADDDTIYGNDGADFISDTEGGSDLLYGGNGNDYIYIARSQADPNSYSEIYGDAGNDTLFGALYNGSSLLMSGGDGDDQIIVRGTDGLAIVRAGIGADTVQVQYAGVSAEVVLGTGRDTLQLVGSLGFFDGTGEVTVLDFEFGASGDRVEIAGLLASTMTTWDGNSNPFASGYLRLTQSGDNLLLQLDTDGTATGDSFSTILTFDGAQESNVIDANFDFAPSGAAATGGTITVSSGTAVTGTVGADTITVGGSYGYVGFLSVSAGAGNDTFNGGSGRDNVFGGVGDDILNGFGGADTLDGQLGDDTLYGGDGNDNLSDVDGGDDQLFGEGGDDDLEVQRLIYTDVSTVLLNGGGGRDTLDFTTENGSSATLLGGANNDTITVLGTNGSATIDAGNGFDNVFVAATGVSATITFGDGADALEIIGDASNTVLNNQIVVTDFQGGLGGDRIVLGAFFDTVLTNFDGSQNPFLTGHARLVQSGDDTLIQVDLDGGADSYETLITLENTLTRDVQRPNLGSFSGAGAYLGTGGDDVRVGSFGQNYIETYGGNDRLLGLGEDDILIAGAGNDQLNGGDGDDRLFGGTGNDVLRGQDGNDFLNGGAGADRFVFSNPLGANNVDTIDDFTVGDDTIVLNVSIFSQLTAGGLLSGDNFTTGSAAQDADDFIVYNSATGELFYDADGSGSGEAVLFARVDAGTNLSATDFLVGGQANAETPSGAEKIDMIQGADAFVI